MFSRILHSCRDGINCTCMMGGGGGGALVNKDTVEVLLFNLVL